MIAVVQSDLSRRGGSSTRMNYMLPGQSIGSNGRLISTNGLFQFIYQADGNLCLYDSNGNCNWASNTAPSKPGKFSFGSKGNLTVQDHNNNTLWESHTGGQDAAELLLQNNGNLVLYKKDGSVVWQTGTSEILPTYTRDSLFANDTMIPGDILLSKNKMFLMQFRTDGMLMVHDAQGVTLWNTDTYPTATRLAVTPAGNFILYDQGGNKLWAALGSLSDQNKNSHVTMQDDGNLVLYTPKGLAPWSANSLWPIAPEAKPIPVVTTSSCGVVVDGGAEAGSICGAVSAYLDGCATVISGIGLCGAVYTGASFCGMVGNGVSACGADFATFGICGVVAALGGAAVTSISAIGSCGAVATVASLCGAVVAGAGASAIGAGGTSVCGAAACGAEACGAVAEGAGACAEAKGAGACGANATVAEGSGVCGAQAGFCGAVLCVAFPVGGNW